MILNALSHLDIRIEEVWGKHFIDLGYAMDAFAKFISFIVLSEVQYDLTNITFKTVVEYLRHAVHYADWTLEIIVIYTIKNFLD